MNLGPPARRRFMLRRRGSYVQLIVQIHFIVWTNRTRPPSTLADRPLHGDDIMR